MEIASGNRYWFLPLANIVIYNSESHIHSSIRKYHKHFNFSHGVLRCVYRICDLAKAMGCKAKMNRKAQVPEIILELAAPLKFPAATPAPRRRR